MPTRRGERARRRSRAFLDGLDQQGAFAGSTPEESYFVICDERVNPPRTVAEGKVKVLFGIAITKPSDFHAWLITHHGGAAAPASRAGPIATRLPAAASNGKSRPRILRGMIIELALRLTSSAKRTS